MNSMDKLIFKKIDIGVQEIQMYIISANKKIIMKMLFSNESIESIKIQSKFQCKFSSNLTNLFQNICGKIRAKCSQVISES